MLDGTIPVEMQDKYLNIILFETDRLNKLTKSLIELNQFGHHGIHLDIADFDINTMIRTTILTKYLSIEMDNRLSPTSTF